MKRTTMVLVALGLVVVLLGATVGTAMAAGPAQTANGVVAWRGEPGPPPWGRDATFDAVADKLGIDQEALIAERQAGKSLAQIAAEHGVSADARVADGTLTQEQVDAMYTTMQERVTTAVERTATGPEAGQGMNRGKGQGAGMGIHTPGTGGGMMHGGRWASR